MEFCEFQFPPKSGQPIRQKSGSRSSDVAQHRLRIDDEAASRLTAAIRERFPEEADIARGHIILEALAGL